MRLAVSALTAASGLILLGLALFGRPDAYLRAGHRRWTDLWQGEKDDAAEPVAAQVRALQQQVMQLRDQIAAARPPVPTEAPAPAAPAALASTAPAAAEAGSLKPAMQPAPPPAGLAPALPLPAAPAAAAIPPGAPVGAPVPARPFTPPPVPQAPRGPAIGAEAAAPAVVPERRESAKPVLPSGLGRQEAPPAQPDADATQAVLARLRLHLAPAAAPVSAAPFVAPRRPDAAVPDAAGPPAPNPEPTHANSTLANPPLANPTHERLAMARAALLNGAVADAVRLLQQAQLQLVFRPVTPDSNEPGTAGQGAGDVARALAALGSGDPRRGLMFIERAMTGMSGAATGWQPPVPPPPGGYAPAYPLR